jgi:hypothetical protein
VLSAVTTRGDHRLGEDDGRGVYRRPRLPKGGAPEHDRDDGQHTGGSAIPALNAVIAIVRPVVPRRQNAAKVNLTNTAMRVAAPDTYRKMPP